MDAKAYVKQKAAGLASLVKINDSYAVIWQQYAPDGTLTTQVDAVGIETANTAITDLDETKAAWQEVLADMTTAK